MAGGVRPRGRLIAPSNSILPRIQLRIRVKEVVGGEGKEDYKLHDDDKRWIIYPATYFCVHALTVDVLKRKTGKVFNSNNCAVTNYMFKIYPVVPACERRVHTIMARQMKQKRVMKLPDDAGVFSEPSYPHGAVLTGLRSHTRVFYWEPITARKMVTLREDWASSRMYPKKWLETLAIGMRSDRGEFRANKINQTLQIAAHLPMDMFLSGDI
ncbi:hypothetical protein C8R44DRAFT_727352 [Mycena epipterygia]|nr:hypothetical protein C8R44DRAFT_727352 [Mycena epipterygia]